MPIMANAICGNNIKSTLCTLTRNYSGTVPGRRSGLLQVGRSSVSYELVVRLSGRKYIGVESEKNYYDVLQLTPKATQAQVKSAYYKLSKAYHPDQSKGEDTSVMFRQIAEAYEVLGNFHKRKMYDKGLLSVSAAATPTEAEAYSAKFYESRSTRSHAPTAKGRTPIFDFDEWTKVHYESNRVRRESAKVRYQRIVKNREIEIGEKKTESIVSLLILGIVLYGIHYCSQVDVDVGKPRAK